MAEIKSGQIEPSKKETERQFHFSERTKPIVDVLTGSIKNLPLDTDSFVDKIGEENTINLVSELIEQKAFGTQLFADALALVRFEKLPEKLKDWFREKGLVLLERENIRVHLRHKNEAKARTCHEVGEYIIDGQPTAQGFDTSKKPTYVSLNSFTQHERNERFPRGALAEVNIWNKEHPILQYTLSGCYVAGTGPNARGIIVPVLENSDECKYPIIYMHTKGSFKKQRKERNFYIRQERGDVDKFAEYGFEALGMYLKGEIPPSEKDQELLPVRDFVERNKFKLRNFVDIGCSDGRDEQSRGKIKVFGGDAGIIADILALVKERNLGISVKECVDLYFSAIRELRGKNARINYYKESDSGDNDVGYDDLTKIAEGSEVFFGVNIDNELKELIDYLKECKGDIANEVMLSGEHKAKGVITVGRLDPRWSVEPFDPKTKESYFVRGSGGLWPFLNKLTPLLKLGDIVSELAEVTWKRSQKTRDLLVISLPKEYFLNLEKDGSIHNLEGTKSTI